MMTAKQRMIEILAEELHKISVRKKGYTYPVENDIKAVSKAIDYPTSDVDYATVAALTAMQRAVEEATTPKDEAEFMTFMLVNITRMSDEKRSEFIKDLFVRYPELNPLRAEVERLKDIRPSVILFAKAMEDKLKKNDHKGGWQDCEIDWLIEKIEEELEELKKVYGFRKADCGRSVSDGIQFVDISNEAIINECADIANFAMMVADLFKDDTSPPPNE